MAIICVLLTRSNTCKLKIGKKASISLLVEPQKCIIYFVVMKKVLCSATEMEHKCYKTHIHKNITCRKNGLP